jgi:hypothetical protein
VTDRGLRHTAAEAGKTSSDDATTKTHLLQLVDGSAADAAYSEFRIALTGVSTGATSTDYGMPNDATAEYSTVKAAGKVSRYATFASDETIVMGDRVGP